MRIPRQLPQHMGELGGAGCPSTAVHEWTQVLMSRLSGIAQDEWETQALERTLGPRLKEWKSL